MPYVSSRRRKAFRNFSVPCSMIITNTVFADLDTLDALFDEAIAYQRSRFPSHVWQKMNRPLITREIEEKLHWKIMEEGQIAGFFSMLYTDAMVWDERDADPS